MHTILVEHHQRYPLWSVEDVYKLIQQAAMGSEHALSDETRVGRRLQLEIARLGPGPDEPLLDPISPDGQIVRVHLRTFCRLRLDPESLIAAFLGTAREFPPSGARLAEYAAAAVSLARNGTLPFDPDLVAGFLTRMQSAGCPAVHHSHDYVAAYRPAYRVIARNFLPQDFPDTG